MDLDLDFQLNPDDTFDYNPSVFGEMAVTLKIAPPKFL
jgi:hypothetical protein